MNSEPLLESLVSIYVTGEQSLIRAEENRFHTAAVSAVREAFQGLCPPDQVLVCSLSREMQQGFFKDQLIASLEKLGFQTLVEHVRLGRSITASQLRSAEYQHGLGFRSDDMRSILDATGKAIGTLCSALMEDRRINDWVLSSLRGEMLQSASLADVPKPSAVEPSSDEWETEPIAEFHSVPPRSTGSFRARIEMEGKGRPLELDLDEL